MKKRYAASPEEIKYVKEVVSDILGLHNYNIVTAENEFGGKISMSKETFLKLLEDALN